jgi:hypothetical protein
MEAEMAEMDAEKARDGDDDHHKTDDIDDAVHDDLLQRRRCRLRQGHDSVSGSRFRAQTSADQHYFKLNHTRHARAASDSETTQVGPAVAWWCVDIRSDAPLSRMALEHLALA